MVKKSKLLDILKIISISISPSRSEVSIVTSFPLNSPIPSISSSVSKPSYKTSSFFSKPLMYSLELSIILEVTNAL